MRKTPLFKETNRYYRKTEIGDVHGLWTITGDQIPGNKKLNIKRKIPARCRCGVERNVILKTLLNGTIHSCGCTRPKAIVDVNGKVFGRWTVIKESELSWHRKHRWECRCVCGNIRHITLHGLRTGKHASCGCLRNEMLVKRSSLPYGESQRNHQFSQYQYAANKRDLEWGLDRPLFDFLITHNCFYCGIEPLQSARYRKKEGIKFNGIDRKDPMQGYIKDNVVTCCKTCNFAKQLMSVEEFKEWIKRVATHLRLLE